MTRLVLLVMLAACTLGCASSDAMKEIARPRLSADPAKATVVFVRPSSAAPNTLVTVLDEHRRFVGDSLASSCFVAKVDPGKHVFVGWAANTTALVADLEPNEIYFVHVVVRIGALSARANLFGVRAGAAKEKVDGWLRRCTFYGANEERGQARLDKNENEAWDRVRRAHELVDRFGKEDRIMRSLRGEDGRTDYAMPQ